MGIGLYVHIPFCLRKCNYCDFVSYPCGDIFAGGGTSVNDELQRAYIEALAREMELDEDILAQNCVDTLYIGGGTPTCLSPVLLQSLLAQLHRRVRFSAEPEITVEANPGTLDEEKLNVLKQFGVNRISLGVQSFDDKLLTSLGRIHGSDGVYQTYKMIRAAGFGNVSLDLMYALPRQTLAHWLKTMQEAVRLQPEHVSAYGLKIEISTPFGDAYERGELVPCNEDRACLMVAETHQYLEVNGYKQYEISNYAKPGYECRHNLKYWRYEPYLGLGVAAHSFIANCRKANTGNIDEYVNSVDRGELPVVAREQITPQMAMGEYIMLALRLREGLSRSEFTQRFGEDLMDLCGSAIIKFERLGLLEEMGNNLRLTERGMLLANEVMSAFV